MLNPINCKCFICGKNGSEEDMEPIASFNYICREHIFKDLHLSGKIPPTKAIVDLYINLIKEKIELKKSLVELTTQNKELQVLRSENNNLFTQLRKMAELENQIAIFKHEVDKLNKQSSVLIEKKSDLESQLLEQEKKNKELQIFQENIAPTLHSIENEVTALKPILPKIDKDSKNIATMQIDLANVSDEIRQIPITISDNLSLEIAEIKEKKDYWQDIMTEIIKIELESAIKNMNLNAINEKFNGLDEKIKDISIEVSKFKVLTDDYLPLIVKKLQEIRNDMEPRQKVEIKNIKKETDQSKPPMKTIEHEIDAVELPDSHRIVLRFIQTNPGVSVVEIISGLESSGIKESNIRNKILPNLMGKNMITKSNEYPPTYKAK